MKFTFLLTGKVIFKVVHNLSKYLIKELISENCENTIQIFSGDYTIYNNLENHEMVTVIK
jgi:hypothetical protein